MVQTLTLITRALLLHIGIVIYTTLAIKKYVDIGAENQLTLLPMNILALTLNITPDNLEFPAV